MDETQDAIQRTDLANERTQLAWWRTGLTAHARSVTASLKRGGSVPSQDRVLIGLTAIGIVLAAATTVLILLD